VLAFVQSQVAKRTSLKDGEGGGGEGGTLISSVEHWRSGGSVSKAAVQDRMAGISFPEQRDFFSLRCIQTDSGVNLTTGLEYPSVKTAKADICALHQ
jgi:hypothetical protein